MQVKLMSVGVQLLPVLWVALAVEATWLRMAFSIPTTDETRVDRRFVLIGAIPLGPGNA